MLLCGFDCHEPGARQLPLGKGHRPTEGVCAARTSCPLSSGKCVGLKLNQDRFKGDAWAALHCVWFLRIFPLFFHFGWNDCSSQHLAPSYLPVYFRVSAFGGESNTGSLKGLAQPFLLCSCCRITDETHEGPCRSLVVMPRPTGWF